MHCNNPELYPGATGRHAGQPRHGRLRSSHGREKGLMALEEVSTTKTVVNC